MARWAAIELATISDSTTKFLEERANKAAQREIDLICRNAHKVACKTGVRTMSHTLTKQALIGPRPGKVLLVIVQELQNLGYDVSSSDGRIYLNW